MRFMLTKTMSTKLIGRKGIIDPQLEQTVDIIIPTYNNTKQLIDALDSLEYNTTTLRHIIIVNNGEPGLKNVIKGGSSYTIVEPGKNLGWMGGINEGVKHSKGKYIMMMNDDVVVVPGQYDWMNKMMDILENDDTVGEVGPSSNVVAGSQNIWNTKHPTMMEVPYLIGFCAMLPRELFLEIGGLDEDLTGGDDFDLAIRLHDAGKRLVARRDVFLYHIGFQTGERLHGGPDKPNGWNSKEMENDTQIQVIRKHGVKKFHRTWYGLPSLYEPKGETIGAKEEVVLKTICKGKGLDVGCGNKKICKDSIGVDLVAKGEEGIAGLQIEETSIADVQSDGHDMPMFKDSEMDYIISSHSIEHMIDPLEALLEWHRILKKGGRVGIVTPDSEHGTTRHLDSSHVHDFTKSSLSRLVKVAGFEIEQMGNCKDGWSLYIIATKV